MGGAIYGVSLTFLLQSIVGEITGVPLMYEALIIAFFFTGAMSMLVYDISMPIFKGLSKGTGTLADVSDAMYEFFAVKHDPAKGHVGYTPPSDMTQVAPHCPHCGKSILAPVSDDDTTQPTMVLPRTDK